MHGASRRLHKLLASSSATSVSSGSGSPPSLRTKGAASASAPADAAQVAPAFSAGRLPAPSSARVSRRAQGQPGEPDPLGLGRRRACVQPAGARGGRRRRRVRCRHRPVSQLADCGAWAIRLGSRTMLSETRGNTQLLVMLADITPHAAHQSSRHTRCTAALPLISACAVVY